MAFRSDQGSQKLRAGRPTSSNLAEKVRRLEAAPLLGLSNRPTSSNLPRAPARICAGMCAPARAPVCVNQVRQVRRLDGFNMDAGCSRLTFRGEVGRTKGDGCD